MYLFLFPFYLILFIFFVGMHVCDMFLQLSKLNNFVVLEIKWRFLVT